MLKHREQQGENTMGDTHDFDILVDGTAEEVVRGEVAMEMSFAQALNEAKQVIVQQSNRIKADAEKIKQQQRTIVDQCSIITDAEMKLKEQTAKAQAAARGAVDALEANIAQAVVAREQAEAIVDRQGQRLTNLQAQSEQQESRIASQIRRSKSSSPNCKPPASKLRQAITSRLSPPGRAAHNPEGRQQRKALSAHER